MSDDQRLPSDAVPWDGAFARADRLSSRLTHAFCLGFPPGGDAAEVVAWLSGHAVEGT